MAFSLTLAQGGTLIIPDSAVNINVQSNPTGIATSGVVAIVGESDEGPSWSQDLTSGSKLSENSFGVTDIGRIIAKYGSGNIVDAFRGIATPSASPRIIGGPNRIIVVKTNNSTKASRDSLNNHGTFEARRGGEGGNGIQETVTTSQPEVAPTTGGFSYIPSASSSALAVRVNGGSKQSLAIAADFTPAALADALTNLSFINAVGGVDRSVLSGLAGINIELTVVSGQTVDIKLASGSTYQGAPAVGDTLRIPAGSVIDGPSSENVGWYLVTGVNNSSSGATITAKKITAGAPVNVSPVAISGTPASDMIVWSWMKINNMSGTNRNALDDLIGQNLTLTALSSTLTVTLAAGQVFASTPRAGDIVYIPSGSPFDGASNENIGWYQVTSSSNNTTSAFIKMSRLSNGLPVSVTTTPIAATTDLQVYLPQIKGIGKTLELFDDGGTVNVSTIFKDLGIDDPADWLETLLTSSAELQKTFTITRTATNSLENFTVGGNVAFTLGYNGTSASCTIGLVSGVLRLQTTVSGGAGANLDLDLSKIPNLNTLVARINENTGYSAAILSTADGIRNPSVLDRTTFSIASTLNNRPGRVKRDLWDLTQSTGGLNNGSALVQYIPNETAGLPEDNAAAFLSGGAKGGTTGLQFSQAIDALQAVRCNFVVPLVSQDASEDIEIGQTEASSTYTVDAVNAAVKSHVLNMSTPKTKRHRIGLVSKRGTFAEARASAQSMSTFRIAHFFQDVTDLNADGQLEDFHPWMGAVKAAGMQSAGAYKAIFNKQINISGAKQAAGDFDDENTSQVEDALLAGLIPIQRQELGGFVFVSDQLTYNLDNNFVFNSLQAVYVADLMALSLAQSLKNAFVGESVADVTVGAVESFIKSKMAEFLALKFTVSSPQQGAPGGWKSISVNISAGVLEVRVLVIEATSIYFIPINLDIEGIRTSNAA